jgi:ATP-dependent Clp protease ATP-binding subunit ClpB
LDRDQIRAIVDLQIERLETLVAKQDLSLVVTEAARNAIAAEGYDPLYGARPLKRVIQTRLQNPLATELLKGEFQSGDCVKIDHRSGQFAFARLQQPELVTSS